jgi:general stress protein 26
MNERHAMSKEAYSKILAYIDHHPIATVSTSNADGSPHGAIVYVCADNHNSIVYFITKQETRKYKNLQDRSSVCVTIVSPADNSTLQADGRAFTVQDPLIIDMVMEKISRDHTSAKEWLPPIAKLRAGAYEVVGVELSRARLAKFQGMAIGSEHIFTGGEV